MVVLDQVNHRLIVNRPRKFKKTQPKKFLTMVDLDKLKHLALVRKLRKIRKTHLKRS